MEYGMVTDSIDMELAGRPVMNVQVSIEPKNWLQRFFWRWIKPSMVRMTWVECTDEILREYLAE